ncbi:hypothetical protein E0Z10_g2718 [Xylaria hypoxylon]|uniref:HD domain-containing protein n=1 Tax=Xylaria hypoxylon TaxID=37992 RepID=A0A4Z0Z3M6_9PEZI|nr:hypothetical protein E0Z10_g2718 [Xylaria hypoxylon]
MSSSSSPFPDLPISGVSFPHSPITIAALAYTKEHTTEAVYNHCVRAAYFALILVKKLEPLAAKNPDLETVVLACVLHDMGWSFNKELLSTFKRFEIDGADIARAFIEGYKGRGGEGAEKWDEGRIQKIWDVIALHSLLSIAPFASAEVATAHLGIISDFAGPRFPPNPWGDPSELIANPPTPGALITVEEFKEVLGAFPYAGFGAEGCKEILCGLCRDKPVSTFDNFVGGFGRDFGLDGKGTGKEEFTTYHSSTRSRHTAALAMAPDRGLTVLEPQPEDDFEVETEEMRSPTSSRAGDPPVKFLPEGRHFTIRGVVVGLLVGLVIVFSNILLGFGIFRTLSRHLSFPFTPVENVLVQSVAGGMAIMPLGCGFVGVLPAMEYLLEAPEQGPIRLSMGKLIIWSLGLCYFGVVFAVPLRRQVIIREQLKFPSGFSTAVLIGVLHGKGSTQSSGALDSSKAATFGSLALENQPLYESEGANDEEDRTASAKKQSWAGNIKLLLITFGISGIYTLCTFFFPTLRNLPIFGTVAAETWLWTLNPSLAYVGQGIIMGPATTIHMLLGAIIGWGILSPLAKNRGWAPGPVSDWKSGSKGWIVWTSLAIMLADAVISLGYIALRPVVERGPALLGALKQRYTCGGLQGLFRRHPTGYAAVAGDEASTSRHSTSSADGLSGLSNPSGAQGDRRVWDHDDAPPEQLVGNKTVGIGLVLSVIFCVASIHITFGDLVPLYGTIIAVFMAMVLSIMGVRALGETDLNPVSGISKIAQLFFALIIPQSNKASVLINLIAGAVSEAGALQAGDLMQDLKTGHLLGAAPKAQFWGQIIGATVGAVVSAWIYRLYTAVYEVPGEIFEVPTAYVWIFTARLVTGKGLPYMAREFAMGAAIIFAVFTILRTKGAGKKWHAYIPGGIAVAVGMYNVPSFTLARTIGGLMNWYWRVRLGKDDTPLIVLASGFILGEGFLSIVNLILQSAQVPHL